MDATAWVAVVAASISLGGLIPAFLQVKSMKQQTKIQREQTRLQAEIQKDAQRPFVWVDFRVNPQNGQAVQLVLKNEGPTIAENIRVECEPQMRRTKRASQHDGTDEIPLFSSGVTSMPPGREMRWFVGVGSELYAEGKLAQHKIKISYDGPFGPEKPVEYNLSSLDFKEAVFAKEGSLADVERAVKGLRENNSPLNRIATALEKTIKERN
ncbi:hypothetical protein ACFSYH_01970 [Populibacterium corticicola]|uniref:Uncharacterized protein n=1 Tax=Populibacterium corticicola TaxID=1812826 RepID=A0ABW5XES0_9MICO